MRLIGAFVRNFGDVVRGRSTGLFGPFTSRRGCRLGTGTRVCCGWITILKALRGGNCQLGDGVCGWQGDGKILVVIGARCTCFGFGFVLKLCLGLDDAFVFLRRRTFVAGLGGAGCGLRSTLGRGERRVVGCIRGEVGTEMGWDRR